MPTATFGAREVFAPANSIKSEPAFTANGEELWVASDRNTGGTFVRHLYRGARDASGNYGGGVRVTELESAADDSEFGVAFSHDGLTIYFGTDREGETHVYSARRASIGAPFTGVAPVASIKSGAADIPGWLSPDNCRFYFASERGGTSDLFVASR